MGPRGKWSDEAPEVSKGPILEKQTQEVIWFSSQITCIEMASVQIIRNRIPLHIMDGPLSWPVSSSVSAPGHEEKGAKETNKKRECNKER